MILPPLCVSNPAIVPFGTEDGGRDVDDEILRPGARWRFMPVAILLAAAMILTRAVAQFGTVLERFVHGDNDDIMRLMEVRDWLAGQGWFDMMQYRILPPDGVPMHWSRYVDAGIGGLMSALALVVPPETAERLTLVIWPSLLLALLVALVGRGTWRILGPLASALAMAVLLTWNPVANVTFKIGRIDHHNVQILMISAMAFAMVWPGRPALRGALAGAAAALSLAVGLEMLPLILGAWVMLGLRAATGREGAAAFLMAFGLVLLALSPLLMVGQTAPAEWYAPYCDELATPALSLVAAGAAASVLPVLARGRLRPVPLAGLMLAVALAGCVLAAPLLVPCLSGPYAALPADVQAAISSQITEAQPGLLFLSTRPLSYAAIVAPAAVAVIGAGVMWLRSRSSLEPGVRDAVGQMLVLGAIGLLGTFAQMRMILLAVPAVAFLGGFLLSRLMVAWRRSGSRAVSLAMIGATAGVLLAEPLGLSVSRLAALTRADAAAIEAPSWDNGCRDAASLGELQALPPATILTTSNLGVPLIFLTHHDGATAPYHRSAAGFWNEFFPFRSEANMREALDRSDIGYVAICRGSAYGKSLALARALADGTPPAWLVPVLPEAKALAVFRVDRTALEATE